ncbi:hypothetical protein JNJ66_00195 [Candidatus Saccharibacteria bacterium]|nr:hypothetical protein [Candidatus Saccharibacteria bacterium]
MSKPKKYLASFYRLFLLNVFALPVICVLLYVFLGPDIFGFGGGGYVTGGGGFRNNFGWFMLHIFMPLSMSLAFVLTGIAAVKAFRFSDDEGKMMVGLLTFIAFGASCVVGFWRWITT